MFYCILSTYFEFFQLPVAECKGAFNDSVLANKSNKPTFKSHVMPD